MKRIDGLDNVDASLRRCVLTIGNFDGMHLAHQRIVARAAAIAAPSKAIVVVLTFEPHPMVILRPSEAPQRLTPLTEKLDYIEAAGAGAVVVARSEPALFALEAEQFVSEVIGERFQPTHIVEGPSFGFGRGRTGTPEILRTLATPLGCTVEIVEPVMIPLGDESVMVSSSLVRRLLGETKVSDAARCLGRPYRLTGTVVRGESRGRTLGFPTANLEIDEQLIPGEGVYAATTDFDGRRRVCAVSIGHTPTFQGERTRVEAHVLDFSGDLYGQSIRLDFHEFVRPQQKFDSPAALQAQLRDDVETVREVISRMDAGADHRITAI